MNKSEEKLIINEYESEFVFKKNISNLNVSFNRSAFIFFFFILISLFFSIKIFYYGSVSYKNNGFEIQKKKNFRADILDRDGSFIAKSVQTINVGINPNKVKDKKKLLLKLKLIFPEKNFNSIETKLKRNKFFYLEKKISAEEYDKVKLLGEKAIEYEPKITRIYPSSNLFSHLVGQIDEDSVGISGLEKSFNEKLMSEKDPLLLTVDTNIQYLIREELLKANKIFNTEGSASILMNINNGEIISLVSTPDFDLNKRESLKDKKFINRVTKGVYEFGSVFKTFTLAAALDQGILEPYTEFKDLPKSLSCAGFPIREYDENIPTNLTAEQILIRSGNIGSVKIGQKVGEEKFRMFLKKLDILEKTNFDIEEIGSPIKFNWGKCPLATTSFGHGITTTLLQLSKAYAIIVNGGHNIKPSLIKREKKEKREKILNKEVSDKILPILRKVVTAKEGTASLANVDGYEVGGKTGTAQKSFLGSYSKNKKINTFVSIFPSSKPKFVLAVMLDEPEINENYIYEYRDGSNFKLKGSPRNTAGWNSVEVTGHIIEKIGPILATKYSEVN